MTYLEKVMQAVKLDKELLTEEQADQLKETFQPAIGTNFCPGDFIIGGPMQVKNTCPNLSIAGVVGLRRRMTDDPRF